jgi:ABC-type uncharacterized transport system ATPase subunit
VKIAVEGDHRLAWIDEIPGVRILRPGFDRTEIELDAGIEPDALLAAAVGRGVRVTHFEVVDASLEQIFIDHVGRPPDEDLHLAPDAEHTDRKPTRRIASDEPAA